MDEYIAAPYFPAVICAEFDSPIDALISLCVPHDEAMNLVAAAWRSSAAASENSCDSCCDSSCDSGGGIGCDTGCDTGVDAGCILATLDGGRHVAVLRQSAGRWAACNAFLDHRCSTRAEAERLLAKLLKRGRRGMVGVLNAAVAGKA